MQIGFIGYGSMARALATRWAPSHDVTMPTQSVLSLIFAILSLPACSAVATDSDPVPDLLGAWSGRFTLVNAEGTSTGVTTYEFTEQTGRMLRGENRWQVLQGPGGPEDHELPRGTKTFLGVIAHDGTIYLVVDGDTAVRRLRLMDADTIDFVEFAGGESPVVVAVQLSRGAPGVE